jgi:hypothetical protein
MAACWMSLYRAATGRRIDAPRDFLLGNAALNWLEYRSKANGMPDCLGRQPPSPGGARRTAGLKTATVGRRTFRRSRKVKSDHLAGVLRRLPPGAGAKILSPIFPPLFPDAAMFSKQSTLAKTDPELLGRHSGTKTAARKTTSS